MKLTLALITMFAGLNAFAADTTQTLVCPEISPNLGKIVLEIDSSPYDPGSGYSAPVNARLNYEYSSVSKMACEGIVKDLNFDVDCVGLYAGFREPTVVKFRTANGQTTADWVTLKQYGSVHKTTACTVQ